MTYSIKAPVETYNRRICGVQFSDGVGSTSDGTVAGWFFGRTGFTVTTADAESEKPAGEDQSKDPAATDDSAKGKTESKK